MFDCSPMEKHRTTQHHHLHIAILLATTHIISSETRLSKKTAKLWEWRASVLLGWRLVGGAIWKRWPVPCFDSEFGHMSCLHNLCTTNDEFIAWCKALETHRHVLLHGTH